MFKRFAPCPTCAGSGKVDPQRRAQILEDMQGKVGRKHPDTSREAAALGLWKSDRRRVLTLLIRNGPQNAYEIAQQMSKSPNQTATRLQELREAGYVQYLRDDEGKIIKTPTTGSHQGRVQAVTGLGGMVHDALWRRQQGNDKGD